MCVTALAAPLRSSASCASRTLRRSYPACRLCCQGPLTTCANRGRHAGTAIQVRDLLHSETSKKCAICGHDQIKVFSSGARHKSDKTTKSQLYDIYLHQM